ncbi:hypothetical protein [Halobacteriovorax sp. HLS]|uniref:hypothetical protein n=1 Tax=Halobacteriovorax sp. HLS TaxID=2234000 RepID=UPI000FD99F58|nr:hypothetical protein [Halobacteriovorax sp. HLS]
MKKHKNEDHQDLEDTPHLQDTSSPKKSSRVDLKSNRSELKGVAGIIESLLRSFKGLAFILSMAPITIVCITSLGLAITPAYLLVSSVYQFSHDFNLLGHSFLMSMAIGMGYFLYGVSIIFVVPMFNKILFLKLEPWRGNWYSLKSLPWYYHNALVQLVRYTFLDLVTPTPLNVLFYKMMGMKVGKGVMINTSNISDPCLITLEDNVTIGGSATLFAHYAQGGFLVIAPVVIKKGATVGLKASIMGDVIVGEKVTVKPHSILLPKTRLNKGDPQ